MYSSWSLMMTCHVMTCPADDMSSEDISCQAFILEPRDDMSPEDNSCQAFILEPHDDMSHENISGKAFILQPITKCHVRTCPARYLSWRLVTMCHVRTCPARHLSWSFMTTCHADMSCQACIQACHFMAEHRKSKPCFGGRNIVLRLLSAESQGPCVFSSHLLVLPSKS